ncbi:MAG: hypothetical protein ACKOPT_17755 [Cyanobium sp.]
MSQHEGQGELAEKLNAGQDDQQDQQQPQQLGNDLLKAIDTA